MAKTKTKNRAGLPKPKLIVYIGRSKKKFLNLTPTPKLVPKGSKMYQKGPNCGQNENKKMGLYIQTRQSAFKGVTMLQSCVFYYF